MIKDGTEVKVFQAAQALSHGSTTHTTGADFCRIFAEEMDSLYMLGLVLTGDAKLAEQCFVAGIGDCVDGNAVFKEWAHSWARRALVQRAIEMAGPGARPGGFVKVGPGMKIQPAIAAVLNLDTLERFVLVMSVLEGYSYQDCSILLGCTRQMVVQARARALDNLSTAGHSMAMPVGELQGIGTVVSN